MNTVLGLSGYAFHPDTVLRTLAASPHIGDRRPDLTVRRLRFHVARKEYLIAYAPDEKPLWSRGSVFTVAGIRG